MFHRSSVPRSATHLLVALTFAGSANVVSQDEIYIPFMFTTLGHGLGIHALVTFGNSTLAHKSAYIIVGLIVMAVAVFVCARPVQIATRWVFWAFSIGFATSMLIFFILLFETRSGFVPSISIGVEVLARLPPPTAETQALNTESGCQRVEASRPAPGLGGCWWWGGGPELRRRRDQATVADVQAFGCGRRCRGNGGASFSTSSRWALAEHYFIHRRRACPPVTPRCTAT